MNTQTSKYELALNRGKTEVLDGKFPVFFFFGLSSISVLGHVVRLRVRWSWMRVHVQKCTQ